MARYKPYDPGQRKLISLEAQILPSSFEHTLSRLIDYELYLRAFSQKYLKEENGAPAYDPRIFLTIVLYAYCKSILGSRRIARTCQDNVVFMALRADSQPHFTTVIEFLHTGLFAGRIRSNFSQIIGLTRCQVSFGLSSEAENATLQTKQGRCVVALNNPQSTGNLVKDQATGDSVSRWCSAGSGTRGISQRRHRHTPE